MRGYVRLLEQADRCGLTVDEVIEAQWSAAEDENDRRRDDAMCERYERDMRAQEVANDI